MFDMFGLERPHKIKEDQEVARLTTVYDVAMLGIVRGLLEEEHIPYLVHERGAGSITKLVAGFSMYGTDIYVPRTALETARDLIAGLEDAEAVELLPEDACMDGTEGGTETRKNQ